MGVYWANLWNTTEGYGATGPPLGYLTAEQNARAERIRVARMLWKGQHRKVFLEEGRTQFPWQRLRAEGVTRQPYVTFNVLRLITTTITDLLIGAEPALRVEDSYNQAALDDLINRSDLHRVFYDAAKIASWAAESVVEVSRWDQQVYVANLPPDEIWPLGQRNADGQYTTYRRFATAKTTEQTPREILLETTYSPGRIERQCYLLAGSTKTQNADLSLWPTKRPDGSPLPPTETTGLDVASIVWMANELDEGKPTSDYDGLLELQDMLNAKETQIACILAKHADLKLAVPNSKASETGDLSSLHNVFFYNNKDEIPSYIGTGNTELANAIADRDFTLQALCIAAELSPVLLGIRHGATPDAVDKLRLEATKSLARAARKAASLRPFIRYALDVALAMENAGRRVSVAAPPSSVELRDGLPVDDLDEAQTLSMLTAGKQVMSLERAVESQLPDPAAAALELERLRTAAREATPAILMGRPADLPASDVGDQTNAPDESGNAPLTTQNET